MPLRNVATNYTFEQQRQEINLLAADVDSLSTTLTNQQGTETTDSPSFNNLYLGSVIYGPSTFTIDPATHGDDTGTLVVKGNLQIDGTTTTVNSTTMTVNDLNITLADGAANAAAANGAGLTVDGAGATLLYNGTTDEWAFNKNLGLTDDKKLLCGASSDLQIYHSSGDSYITNSDGNLNIVNSIDGWIRLQPRDGEEGVIVKYDGAVELYHNNSKKLETTTSGLTIHEDTDKTISFTGGIGEIGSVTGFQALNTAGSALVDFGMRANTLRFATGSAERLRITSDGKLGVNVTSPGCQTGGIHVVHDSTEGTPSFTGGEVGIFQRNFNSSQGCHIGIIGGSSGSSSINFGDKDDADVGIIQYDHSMDSMKFYTSTTQRFSMNSVGTFNFMNGLLVENGIVDTTARNGTQAVNLDNGMVHYFQSSATGTWKPNFRVNSTNTLNNAMNIGDFCSPTMIVNKQNSAHYADSVQVDGSDVTVDWLGGPPTEGGGNNTWDVYSYTILKNGNASFKCWASVSTYNQ